jgi:hypothetical protein
MSKMNTRSVDKYNFPYGFDGRKYISPQGFTQRARGDYQWAQLDQLLHDLAPDKNGFAESVPPVNRPTTATRPLSTAMETTRGGLARPSPSTRDSATSSPRFLSVSALSNLTVRRLYLARQLQCATAHLPAIEKGTFRSTLFHCFAPSLASPLPQSKPL